MLTTLFKWSGHLLTALTALVLLGGFVDPRTFWLPATFGPILPLLLFLTTSLLLFLAYSRKWKQATFPLLVVLLALPSWRKTIAFNAGSPPVPEATMSKDSVITKPYAISIITANIATFKAPEDKNYPITDTAVIRLAKRLRKADFLLTQEYMHSPDDWRSRVMKKHGQYDFMLKAKQGRMGVFSRYPLTWVAEAFNYNKVNGYLVADATTPAGKIRIINVHLLSNRVTGLANSISENKDLRDSGTWAKVKNMFGRYGRASALRCEQAEEIAAIIEKSPYPCIVGGDFNDVPASYPYRILVDQAGLKDSWIEAGTGLGRTFAGALPGLRIDYLLFQTDFSIGNVERLESGHSDHHPLKVKLWLTK